MLYLGLLYLSFLIRVIICNDLQLRLVSTSGSDIEDKILFDGNVLSLECWLDNPSGASAGYADINWTEVTPLITVRNVSWSDTFQFSSFSSENVSWSFDLPRLNFTTDRNYWFPKEQWLLSVNLTVNHQLYTAHMSILDTATEPILQWTIGMEISATALPPGDHVWYSSVSPCAADVVILAATIPTGDVVLRVTRTAFLGNSTESFLLDPCSFIVNCSGVTLLDLVLTNQHVLLLTSGGLLVSNKISAPVDGSMYTGRQNLTWSPVSMLSGCDDIQMGKFRYTRQCMSRIQDTSMVDCLYATIKCQVGSLEKTWAVRSIDPFTEWSELMIIDPTNSSEIFDVAYNLHMKTSVFLYGSPTGSIGVQIQSHGVDGIIKRLVSDYIFPSGVNVTTIEFEPVSHALFAYGQQVWYSTDGGNYFHHFSSPEDTMVDHLTFDHHGNRYLVHCTSGAVLYSMIGSSRLLALSHTSPTVPYITVIDMTGHVIITNLTVGSHAQKIDVLENLKAWSHTLTHSLVPVQTSVTSTVLYEYAAGATVSSFEKSQLGQLVVYSGGGIGIIRGIDLITDHPDFLSATTIAMLEPLVMDTSSTNLDSPLYIEWQSLEVQLQLRSGPSPGWMASDVGRSVLVQFTDSFLITSVINATVATAVSPLMFNMSWTVPSGQWQLLVTAPTIPAWKLKEDECRHVLTSDPQQQTLIELDIQDSVSLSVEVQILAPLVGSVRRHLLLSMSNEHLINSKQQYTIEASQRKQQITIAISKDSNQVGVLAVLVWSSTTSLLCSNAAIIYTIWLSCPCRKRLLYIRPKMVNRTEYLHGNPENDEGAILYDLLKNYRPPSEFGVDIPTAEHIYNADPSLPRQNDRFKISKESGSYKQCEGKPNRTACQCTEDMMYSDDAEYSDCKQRVYRVLHPGIIYPEFTIEQPGVKNKVLGLQKHLVYIWEINNRHPEFIAVSESELLVSVKNDERLATEASTWLTPEEVKIIMVRSGLHHFRAELPPGFSFCPLYVEFQVYVDQTPIAYPLEHILHFGVTMILGCVMFLVYICQQSSERRTPMLRPRGSQCQDLDDVQQYEIGQYQPSLYKHKML